MKRTVKALLISCGMLAPAVGIGVGTTPAHAQGKTITLCWAAWDPANALVSGAIPFPDDYSKLPPERIAHVHAKDCRITGDQKHTWVELGTGDVDWKGQMAALIRDRYRGWISLETHWTGPAGDKHEASVICGRNLVSW